MISLIHGTDNYLSHQDLHKKIEDYKRKNYEIRIINVDETSEVGDPSDIYAALADQDIFGNQKLLILKRIASTDLFYSRGKALKMSQKLFDEIKISHHEIILWEDKTISASNPLYKIAQKHYVFEAPKKDWELKGYINANFQHIRPDIKQLLQNITTTNTYEIATELEKLNSMEIATNTENTDILTLSQNTPVWVISDAIYKYMSNPNDNTLNNIYTNIDKIEEEVRYKLAIIQNAVFDIFIVKSINKIPKLKDKYFSGNRNFVFQNLIKIVHNIDLDYIKNIYLKSLIVEYWLNNGDIHENAALKVIFAGDSKLMSLELLFD